MEWSWTTFFWGVVLFFVFKAVLDRISNNGRVAKFEKRIRALEKAGSIQADVNDRTNENLQQIVQAHTTLQNSHNEVVRTVNRQSETIRALRQRIPPQGTFVASGGGGGGMAGDISFTVAGAGGGGSSMPQPVSDREIATPGRRMSQQDLNRFEVVNIAGDILTLDNGNVSFRARMEPNGMATVIDTSIDGEDTPSRPAPTGQGQRRINLEDDE